MSLTLAQAMQIMGQNGVSVEKSEAYFGPIASMHRTRIVKALFQKDTLESMKESHVLCVDHGMSILSMRILDGGLFTGRFDVSASYRYDEFAKRIENPQWRLLPLSTLSATLPFSVEKTKREQDEFVKTWMTMPPRRDVIIPSARQVTFATIMLWITKGYQFLEPETAVRTRDVLSNDRSVTVGIDDKGKIIVSSVYHDETSRALGVTVFPNHRWYVMPD